ncbi:hypothetical protein MD535_22365 [Vibrio sp. ZSDZ65]|uniref:Conjugal transfer protein TrbJ n=1 Tax=Vibrio qingdaonensis TaxID=2829491 RepID=A0A9X3CS62_9VIBR|nr:hypothetical protein [Vibrio qingdaonensis]MCW8348737.1 hypothetical protein [Vibrio qingdaonensis]
MRTSHRLSLTLLTLSIHLATQPLPVKASGFPVVDVANLLQSVVQYTQILKDYEQMLAQTGLNINQLTTLLDQYTQTMREYQVLLNQVSALERKLERRDYPGLHRDINQLYEDHLKEDTPNQPVASTQRYASVPDKHQVNSLSERAIGATPSHLNQAYRLASDSHTSASERDYYRRSNAQIRADIAHLDEQRLGLGSQSELATLQLIVEQNQILMEQIANLNEMQLSSMSYSNQFEQQSAHAVLSAKVAQLKKIDAVKAQGISIDERVYR